MIEVEVKFILSAEQEERLLRDAALLSNEELVDVYYDTADYQLTSKNMRLRSRNGTFLLKIPLVEYIDFADLIKIPKQEIEDESAIRSMLQLPDAPTLGQAIVQAGFAPHFTVCKRRKKYCKDGVTIDLDDRVGRDFQRACEFEIIVQSPDQIKQAADKILKFAQQHGITQAKLKENFVELMKGNRN